MCSAFALASPPRTSRTSNSVVNPCASMSASVQPSGHEASNSSAPGGGRAWDGGGSSVALARIDSGCAAAPYRPAWPAPVPHFGECVPLPAARNPRVSAVQTRRNTCLEWCAGVPGNRHYRWCGSRDQRIPRHQATEGRCQMNAVNMPGFTAEASLYRTMTNYRAKGVSGFLPRAGAVVTQLPVRPGCGDCTSLTWPNGTPTGACAKACCDVLGRCWTETCPCGSGISGGWGGITSGWGGIFI
jgi:hypothetical protein